MLKKYFEHIKHADFFKNIMHTKYYFIAEIAVNALGFITIPILSRLLSEKEYGYIIIYASYIPIFTILLTLNSHVAVGRYYCDKKDDFKEFFGNTAILISAILIITVPLFIFFYDRIEKLIQLPRYLTGLILCSSVFFICQNLYLQILIPRKESRKAAIYMVISSYSVFVVSIAAVFLFKENRYLGYIIAGVIVNFLFTLYFFSFLKKFITIKPKFAHFKYIFIYAFPLIPYSLSSIILAQFSRIMINNKLGAADAGLYGLAYNVGMLLSLVVGATQKSIIPEFYDFIHSKEYKRLDNLSEKNFSLICVAAFGLILFAKEMVYVLADKKFHPALPVVPIVIVSYVFFGLYTFYARYIEYNKKTYYNSIAVLLSGALNIWLNAVYIPKYGYIAGAYTALVSYFAMFFLVWIAALITVKIPITPIALLLKPLLILFAFIVFIYIISQYNINIFLMIFIKLILLGIFSILVYRESVIALYKKIV